MSTELSRNEIERYSRQLLLKRWGAREQLRLKERGGLISVRAEALLRYLAGAGIGRIGLLGAGENFERARALKALNDALVVSSGPDAPYDFIAIFPDETELIPRQLLQIPCFQIPPVSPAGFRSAFPYLSAQARVAEEILSRFALS